MPSSVLYWEGLLQTSCFNSTDWSGKKGLLEEKVKVVLEQLLRGEYKSAGLDLKRCGAQRGDYPLYTVKLSRDDRLLFTTVQRGKHRQLLLLECIENHDYQKARFMKYGVLKTYMEKEAPWQQVDTAVVAPVAETGFILESVRPVLGGFLTFTDVQESILKLDAPLLILGAAGTGKTCIAQALLSDACERGCSKMLYVAKSEDLVQTVSDTLTVDADATVDVRTYSQLARTTFREVGGDALCEWFAVDSVGEKVFKKLSDKDENFVLVCGRVYEEFRIFSGMSSEEYAALGVRQKLLPSDKSSCVPEAYRQYLLYLQAGNMVDLSFLEQRFETEYDLVVVDEAQDFSRLQLKQLCAAAKDSRIVFCMDPQQSVHDVLSSKDYITSLCSTIQVVTLPETFRTPLAVIPVVNRLLSLRREMVGGVVHKDEYLQVQPSKYTSNRGEVHWVSPKDSRSMKDLRDACGRFALFAVVVSSNDLVAHAVDVFDTPLVLTVEQAKGLEYEHLVVFDPFPEDDLLLRKADRRCPATLTPSTKSNRTKDKTSTHNFAYAMPFNKVFVAFTRTSHALYVVQDTEVHKNIVRCVKGEDVPAQSVKLPDLPESTVSDWESELLRQTKRGNNSIARCIQQRQIDPENFRLEGNNHFKNGDYQLAVQSYRMSLDGRKTVKVFCNLAAACVKLGDFDESIASCRSAIAMDPTYGKAYFRLAKALSMKGGDTAAFLHASVIASAMFRDDPDVLSLTRDVLDGRKAVLVSTQIEFDLCSEYMYDRYFIVLMPGVYRAPQWTMRGHLVGVGNPSLVPGMSTQSHVFMSEGGTELLLAGITFNGFYKARFALILCNNYSKLHMTDCTIRGSSDNGVLCCGEIIATNCELHDIARAGIEIREGGGGKVVGCTITHCKQGISAYGGFDSVTILKSTVSDCQKEGLLLQGASTTPGDLFDFFERPACPVAMKAFKTGANTGAKSKAVVSQCQVLRNKGLGISIDQGITVSVMKTRLSDNGSKGLPPGNLAMKVTNIKAMFKCGILIKGDSTVMVHTCAFSKNGDSGIRIGYNYDAPITIQDCTFAEEAQSIIQEATDKKLKKQFGDRCGVKGLKLDQGLTKMYSAPANTSGIKVVSYARQLPDVTAMESVNTDPLQDLPRNRTPKRTPEPEFNALVKPTHNFTKDPYYAMGTTKGVEVVGRPAEGLGESEWCDVLLGACGDIRNVLSSMSSQHTKEGRFNFVLNDNQPAILARNLVLLNIIVTQTDSKFCLSVWSDHLLSDKCAQVVSDVILQILQGTAPICGDMDEKTKEDVFGILEVWSTLKPSLSDLNARRKSGVDLTTAVNISMDASIGIERRVVQQYFQSGFLPTGSKHQGNFAKSPNVTLFPHGSEYGVYPTCSIFRAVPSPSIESLQSTVEAQCSSLRKAFVEKRFNVSMVCMDLLSFFETTDKKFMFADVSNLIDYSSFPSLFSLLHRVMRRRSSVTFQNCLESPEALRLKHPDKKVWGALSGAHGMAETGSQGHIKFMSAELKGCCLNPYSSLVECLELAKRFDFCSPKKESSSKCSKGSINVLLEMLRNSCGSDTVLFDSLAHLFVHHSSVQKYRPQLEVHLHRMTMRAIKNTVELHLIMNTGFLGLMKNESLITVLTHSPLEGQFVDVYDAVHIFDSFTLNSFTNRLSLKMQHSDASALSNLYATVCLIATVEFNVSSKKKGEVTRLTNSAQLNEFHRIDEKETNPVAVPAGVNIVDAWGILAEKVEQEYVSIALSMPSSAGEGWITAQSTAHEVVLYHSLKEKNEGVEVHRIASSTALIPDRYEVRRDVELRMLSLLLERAPKPSP
eukprot:TRINITY_DN7018_c2_g1_i3.p1 TRINITY_DN7018_c2_g1~~TRINITY_DN7018_c2_g1_i3.p1  ORF type:complete len:1815 (+),score=370.95 TRINITY_DN7018_c2_g1_i3:45-5489(+)